MAEEPSLSYYLPIAGGRIIGFIPFPRVLVLCEMQSVSSRIWTRIAVFISYGDNDNTTGQLLHRAFGLMSILFANGPGVRDSIPGRLKKGTWCRLASYSALKGTDQV